MSSSSSRPAGPDHVPSWSPHRCTTSERTASNILDPVDWKLMVYAVGCLNIAAYGAHKP